MRQMWRVVMGDAPGLKAEIAKLHATERAKLALRDFERGERPRQRWMDDRSPTVILSRPAESPAAEAAAAAGQRVANGDGDSGAGKPTVPSSEEEQATAAQAAAAYAAENRGFGFLSWLMGGRPRNRAPDTEYEPGAREMTRAEHQRYVV